MFDIETPFFDNMFLEKTSNSLSLILVPFFDGDNLEFLEH